MWRTPFRSFAVSSLGIWLLYLLFLVVLVAAFGWAAAIGGGLLSSGLSLWPRKEVPDGPWSRAAAVTYGLPGGPAALGHHRSMVAQIYTLRMRDPDWIARKFRLSIEYVTAVLREFGDDDGGRAAVGARLPVPPTPRFGRI